MALNILSICGSLRKNSYNAMIQRALPSLAPAELSIKAAPPWESIPVFNQDVLDAAVPAPVTDWANAIAAADGVIVVSPEYNWSTPGGLKNAIDWVSKLKDVPFKGKPVALQSASGGQVGGARMQYHMRMTLTGIDAIMFGKPEVFVNFAAKKFNDKGEITDEPTKDIIKTQLAAFAKFVARMSGK